MNAELYKVCPECGGEFQPTVASCADCGVPLVLPEEIAFRDARELRLMPGLAHLRTAPIVWARALAAELTRAGIPYAVDRRAAREEGVLRIYVPRSDLGAAADLDAARRRLDPLDIDDEPPARSARDARRPEPAYKVCPQCGGEYRLEIARCADCGVELVDPEDMGEEEEEDLSNLDEIEKVEDSLSYYLAPPRHELPASDDLVCLTWGLPDVLATLSILLDEAGIGHRIDRGPYHTYPEEACLYVRPEDCDAAERLTEVPEASAEEIDAVQAEARDCAACGTRLPRDAAACPDCGLELGAILGGIVRCPRCGAAGSHRTTGCPNCGAALPPP